MVRCFQAVFFHKLPPKSSSTLIQPVQDMIMYTRNITLKSIFIQNRTTSQIWNSRRQWKKDGRCWLSGASFKYSPWTIFLSVKVFKTLEIWSRKKKKNRYYSSRLSLHSACLCRSHLNTTLLHSVSEKSIFQVKVCFHMCLLGHKFWMARNYLETKFTVLSLFSCTMCIRCPKISGAFEFKGNFLSGLQLN